MASPYRGWDDDACGLKQQTVLLMPFLYSSYAVGKIAIHDFPDQWPALLPTILNVIPTGNDSQLHGALRVLSDLVDESLSEDQFFSMAQDIAKALTEVALNENRKPMLRALAISVFRGCFDLMYMVKDENKDVKVFAEELLQRWNPFFIAVLKGRLPEGVSSSGAQPETWNSIIALQLQVVKTLLRIRRVFPNLLLPQSTTFFTAVWEELSIMQGAYEQVCAYLAVAVVVVAVVCTISVYSVCAK